MEVDLIPLVDALKAGDVIAIPTDTVYGLAAIPEMSEGVKKIFELKGRPEDKPLPVLGAEPDDLQAIASFPPLALELAERFWPGPLTLILNRLPGFDADLGGNETDTIAVRVPDHPATRALLEISGPLAVTSANVSGEPPIADPRELELVFPGLRILDGGETHGEPSTILSLIGDPKVLREGAIPGETLVSANPDAGSGSPS